jgi:hypothetical protein
MEVDWQLVPQDIGTFAVAAMNTACRREQIPPGDRPSPLIRWFAPDGKRFGQYDCERNEIWLSIELADNRTELIRTVGHEIHHASQWRRGFPLNEQAAEEAGARLVHHMEQRSKDLAAAAEASGPAPSFEEMREGVRRALATLEFSKRWAR